MCLEGMCHFIQLTILKMFSWPSLAYYVHKGGLKPHCLFIPTYIKPQLQVSSIYLHLYNWIENICQFTYFNVHLSFKSSHLKVK